MSEDHLEADTAARTIEPFVPPPNPVSMFPYAHNRAKVSNDARRLTTERGSIHSTAAAACWEESGRSACPAEREMRPGAARGRRVPPRICGAPGLGIDEVA